MDQQLSAFEMEGPDDWVRMAKERWGPIKTFCLFSGGGDSAVLAHRCREHYDSLLFIDTNTAVPGVVEFVQEFAAWIGKPLEIRSAGDAYRKMVLEGHGFPGKGNRQHAKAFSRLKERPIRSMKNEVKEAVSGSRHSSANVLFLSGIRRDESNRRSNLDVFSSDGSCRYVNPLIEWTNDRMEQYKEQFQIPKSDVSALLHRSGECNCGAFETEGEREMLESLWPEWWRETIAPLEAECEAQGQRWCRWGGYDLDGNQAAGADSLEADETGVFLCSGCVQQMAMAVEE